MAESLELLAPARNAEVGRTAILAGADAVYIGAPAFGARAAAGNSVADIAALAEFAHRYRARVYVTMNTIVYADELGEVERLVWQLYAAGVDALIVQDMAYLELPLPPIALHASTQCDIRTPKKARRLAEAGFSQLVLPREFTLEEIKAASEAAGVPVEVFVHGALCVSYSGDCQAGFAAMGRSANRGECPQMCRLPYDLVDEEGRAVAPRRHYLSLRDMRRIDSLGELAAAGARSFKIEGRLKDARYVANVTAAYSQALDAVVAASCGAYRRASAGKSTVAFTPDLQRTFNRSYTDYFLRRPSAMASLDTPKWAGMEVGKVTAPYDARRRSFRAKLSQPLSNGDGLGYFDANRQFCGFRLNRAEGDTLYPATPLEGLRPGTVLYRNADKAFFDVLDGADACRRTIAVDVTLRPVDGERIALEALDERGCRAEVVVESPEQAASTPQQEQRRRNMAKTGGTIYTLRGLDDRLGDRFVAASVLTRARRELLEALDTCAASTYAFDRRKASRLASDAFAEISPLTYHDNVANPLAEKFYADHGAQVREKALEVQPREGELTVMTTRYCLRRELGCCLRTPDGGKMPRRLFLRNESGLYRLDFDCADCRMHVVRQAK